VFHHEHLKAVDDSSGLTSVSKQHKKTENTNSVSTDLHVLDTASADMSALLSVSKAGIVSKQEGMASEVVNSDVDFGNLDVDAFYDIVKTITGGCEFNTEFQKCLNESERDVSNINFSSGDLVSLSLSDVMDPVTEKQATPLHCSSENVTSLQSAAMSFQSSEPLHRQTKFVEVQASTQTQPIDNYSMYPWHQNLQVCEPVMPQWQLLPNSMPASCGQLQKYEAVPPKQHPSVMRQVQSHEPHRTQNLQQQQPQRNQVQSLYSSHMLAKQLPAQQAWTQPEWQTSSQCRHQLVPCQSVAKCTGPVVKTELPLSVIVSSNAALQLPPQMLSDNTGGLLSHASAAAYANVAVAAPDNQRQQVGIYSNCQPTFLDCNQPQHPAPLPHFLMNQNQAGLPVNFSQIPEFGSPWNFMSPVTAGQLFGPGRAGETDLMIRTAAQSRDHSAFPLVSSDMLVSPHQLIEQENIPANPQSTGR